MAEHPNEEPTAEPTPEAPREPAGGIGPGALATAGLALIALAILLYFVYPRFSGADETAPRTPGTVVASLVTATPAAPQVTTAPDDVATSVVAPTEGATSAPMVTQAPGTASPLASPTQPPTTATVPSQVAEGAYAEVAGTDELGLRFRSGPGSDFVTWRILSEGEVLLVTGGPEREGDVVWWRAVDRTGLVGWVAEQFLVPVPAPDWTPQPARTPDVTELTVTPES